MILVDWNKLPSFIKNNEVKRYYEILVHKKRTLFFKRVFDILMSLLLIVILSPIFVILAIWIKLDSEGPVFYRQTRICRYGEEFRIYKFRTMQVNADKIGDLITIEHDTRITNVGRKIRKLRFDEIPQVINVLKGEMTFVGTRPEVSKYVSLYTDEMKATLLLPPGITSLASIKFKDEDKILHSYMEKNLTVDEIYETYIIPEKMKLNLLYLKEFNILYDLKLCIKTLGGE